MYFSCVGDHVIELGQLVTLLEATHPVAYLLEVVLLLADDRLGNALYALRGVEYAGAERTVVHGCATIHDG